ncbi:(2Fe-2S)-binding protein [Cohnella boryungensis]|uniref:(2Fe-2S)-binding protein n=1 Tax=Cohnella boryungensis TaxID=768479 RepID=A0ABV8SIH8_9BACL
MSTIDFRRLEEEFFLTLHEPENIVLPMPATDLLQAENMKLLIDTYGPLIQTNERTVAATFFASWLGGVCGAIQDAFYRGDEAILDLSLWNLSIRLYADERYPLFTFKINKLKFIEIPAVDYEAWCKSSIESFYGNNITPLIEILSHLGQMSVTPLWGQIVNSLHAQMAEVMGKTLDEECRKIIDYHYNLLSKGVDSGVFGLRRNPFDREMKFIAHPTNPERKIPLKTACCLAYRLEANFGYCYACPRIKEADRALMRANDNC